MKFGKACEDISWNHRISTPHRSETNGIAGRAVRRVKEGTSAVLLRSGLDEKWWADSMECYCYMRNVRDVLADGETHYEMWFEEPFNGPILLFWAVVEYHPISARDQATVHQFGWNLSWLWVSRGVNLERRYSDSRSGRFAKMDAKEILIRQKGDEFTLPFADGTAKLSGRDHEFRERKPVRSEDLSGEL